MLNPDVIEIRVRVCLQAYHKRGTVGSRLQALRRPHKFYIPLKTKLISFVSFDPIVIVCVDVPSFSCHALMV
jgi:hypothetical protein